MYRNFESSNYQLVLGGHPSFTSRSPSFLSASAQVDDISFRQHLFIYIPSTPFSAPKASLQLGLRMAYAKRYCTKIMMLMLS